MLLRFGGGIFEASRKPGADPKPARERLAANHAGSAGVLGRPRILKSAVFYPNRGKASGRTPMTANWPLLALCVRDVAGDLLRLRRAWRWRVLFASASFGQVCAPRGFAPVRICVCAGRAPARVWDLREVCGSRAAWRLGGFAARAALSPSQSWPERPPTTPAPDCPYLWNDPVHSRLIVWRPRCPYILVIAIYIPGVFP
ncbi:hypothetical protein LMG27177_01221 [Paraburkholderia fynbosensis]|uniref:Uncharacterized protein n=1 Tax=Paraburkholderia fynbosensis TaxID=1200993 RepID=A0A6J5FLD6_9BURK|nr:hypothetical protein LMG27177_01221 [Paraburkholderia fynbosensis]